MRVEPLNTPVLLVIFNRPSTTASVFASIRNARPSRLFVASDGPRNDRPGEFELVESARAIATAVDWPCELKTLFHPRNLGCGIAVKAAIDWFFTHVDSGIILEDDTVPSAGFFLFCRELLLKYEPDSRIGMVAGVNHTNYRTLHSSYVFSRNKACWGWATWRRAWQNMDLEMAWRVSPQAPAIMANMGASAASVRHWNHALEWIDRKRVNTWAWPWYFSLAAQNQLTIFPSVNLVSNIGFGAQATHTKGMPKPEVIRTSDIGFPLVHPQYVCPEKDFDLAFERRKFRRHRRGFSFLFVVVSVVRRLRHFGQTQ